MTFDEGGRGETCAGPGEDAAELRRITGVGDRADRGGGVAARAAIDERAKLVSLGTGADEVPVRNRGLKNQGAESDRRCGARVADQGTHENRLARSRNEATGTTVGPEEVVPRNLPVDPR